MRASQIIRQTDKSLEKGNRVLVSIENTIQFVDKELKKINITRQSYENFLTGPFIDEENKLKIIEE